MQGLKSNLLTILTEARTTTRTQFVLNWGPYGAGKTHASLYFRELAHWPRPKVSTIAEVLSLYVLMPNEPSGAVDQLYRDVVEVAGLDRARQLIKQARSALGDESVRTQLDALSESHELAKALFLLSDDDSDQLLLNAYFLGSLTSAKALTLGLARTISSMRDRFRVLAALLNVMVGLSTDLALTHHRRIVIWLDEGEHLSLFRAREYTPLSQGLRELIDRVPHFLTIFLNFTLAEPELSYIEQILGKALISRATHDVCFSQPTLEEAVDYVRDLFRQERPEHYRGEDYFPFAQPALRKLLQELPERTPREINKVVHNALSIADQQGAKPPLGLPFVDSLSKDQLEHELT